MSDSAKIWNSRNSFIPENIDQERIYRNVYSAFYRARRKYSEESASIHDIQPDCIEDQVAAYADDDAGEDRVHYLAGPAIHAETIDDAGEGGSERESREKCSRREDHDTQQVSDCSADTSPYGAESRSGYSYRYHSETYAQELRINGNKTGEDDVQRDEERYTGDSGKVLEAL